MAIFSVDSVTVVIDWLISFCSPEVAKDSVWFGRVLGSEVSSTVSDTIAVVTSSEDARDKGAGEEVVAAEEDSTSTKLPDIRVVDSVDGEVEMVAATLSVSVSSCLLKCHLVNKQVLRSHSFNAPLKAILLKMKLGFKNHGGQYNIAIYDMSDYVLQIASLFAHRLLFNSV